MREQAEDLASNERMVHAFAIGMASIVWKGEPGNTEAILGLAEEFVDYVMGDAGAHMPRADLLDKIK